MVETIASFFGAKPKKPKAPAKPTGPSPAQLKIQAAQAEETKRLDIIEAKEKKKARSFRAVIGARAGRGQGVTLNPRTGERGVIPGGQLGGA